jgi:hypothetical protein
MKEKKADLKSRQIERKSPMKCGINATEMNHNDAEKPAVSLWV